MLKVKTFHASEHLLNLPLSIENLLLQPLNILVLCLNLQPVRVLYLVEHFEPHSVCVDERGYFVLQLLILISLIHQLLLYLPDNELELLLSLFIIAFLVI